ncbi:MAG: rhodanese-like domain-containing protein [Bacteroidetes bacterium]|nr:MAG: rhodanese-like domain-containing protein [Bacteroidota bacterium]
MEAILAIDLKRMLDEGKDIFLLDVREHYEWELGHLESVHIPMGEVCQNLERLPEDKWIVVLCKSGRRAEALSNLLCCEHGFKKLYYLDGGLTSWKETVDSQLVID